MHGPLNAKFFEILFGNLWGTIQFKVVLVYPLRVAIYHFLFVLSSLLNHLKTQRRTHVMIIPVLLIASHTQTTQQYNKYGTGKM